MNGDPSERLDRFARRLDEALMRIQLLRAELDDIRRLTEREYDRPSPPHETHPKRPPPPVDHNSQAELPDEEVAEPEIATRGDKADEPEHAAPDEASGALADMSFIEEAHAEPEPPAQAAADQTALPPRDNILSQMGPLFGTSRPATSPPDEAASRPVNWESVIGGNWLNRIGVIALLVAGAFFIHLAWQRNWIRPAAQVGSIIVVGVSLIGGGEVFQRRKLPVFAQGLTSLGILALYASGLVGYHLHGLLSLQTTFILYTVITASSFLIAARSNSIAVVLLGMLGGYLTPIILSTGEDAAVALFTYLLFLNAAIMATAIARRWEFLMPIALAATGAMFVAWFTTFYEPPKRWTIETMLSLHAGLFVAASIVPYAVLRRPSTDLTRGMLSVTGMTFFGVTYLLFRSVEGHHLGEFAAAYGAGFWVLAGIVYALRRQPEQLIAYLLGLGAIFVTVAVPIYFSGDARAVAWAAQGLVFTVIGVRYASPRTLSTAFAVFGLALLWTLYHDVGGSYRGAWGALDIRFGTSLLVAVPIAAAGLVCRAGHTRPAGIPDTAARHLSFALLVIADVLAVIASVHQFAVQDLALVWTVNGVAVCALAAAFDHLPGRYFGLLALAPPMLLYLTYQGMLARDETWIAGIDLRFAQGLFVVGGVWLGAFLGRRDGRWRDLPEPSTVATLAGCGVLFVATWLQWRGVALTYVWALIPLGIAIFARWQQLRHLAWWCPAALAWVTVWWLKEQVSPGIRLETWPSIRAGFASSPALLAAGWLAAWIFHGRAPKHLATGLALVTNLIVLVAIGLQWDGYPVLTLWAIDVAVLWAVGFRFRQIGARYEAIALWILLLGGWILAFGLEWSRPLEAFRLILNPRFGALALTGVVGLAATWAYRRYRYELAGGVSNASHDDVSAQKAQRDSDSFLRESYAHVVCVVVANVMLAAALTMEVTTLFDRFETLEQTPFTSLEMARQATLSIVWASYAAILFIVGFAIRHTPIRILAMVSLGPILLKVFLVDLRNLELIYRVLSFAVLGIVLVGISYLYQRYRSRLGLEPGTAPR